MRDTEFPQPPEEMRSLAIESCAASSICAGKWKQAVSLAGLAERIGADWSAVWIHFGMALNRGTKEDMTTFVQASERLTPEQRGDFFDRMKFYDEQMAHPKLRDAVIRVLREYDEAVIAPRFDKRR